MNILEAGITIPAECFGPLAFLIIIGMAVKIMLLFDSWDKKE